MKTYETPYVSCVFDRSHSVPKTRLPNHLQKCEEAFKFNNPGLKVYHCKHYYFHILFDEQEMAKHQDEDCPEHPDKVRLRSQETERAYRAEREQEWEREEQLE